ncbi:MAG TPA: hypothetical protein DCZ95_02090 [Verrucomicrobia bacterium]|nr:MAG: hypothetical protein A2X46_00755 [Lentisphaerae bacterium GWF2_57_35]HBA82861.1 hypothetical protein [Verrucomicrobiota bacterium]
MLRKLFRLVFAICLGLAGSCEHKPQTSFLREEAEVLLCTPPNTLTPDDNAFLDDLQHRMFEYFWNEIFPETGIAIDHTENRIGKVAATGFELAAVCIGVQRGWIDYEQGYERSLRILKVFDDDPSDPQDPVVDGQYGLFWHFIDGHTGKMKPLDCVALCDSADLIAGVLVAGEFFHGTEIETLARRIVNRVQWDQFVSRNPDGSPGLLSFGWVPPRVSESYPDVDGLLPFNMSGFADNSLLIYALALGSAAHPIPQSVWEQYVDSYTLDEYAGYECVMVGQLFCRQVPQSFIRFSRKRDRKIDYFLDTVNALLADRAFNMKENGYPPELWGLTDCFGKDSYTHAAPPGPIMNDGAVGATAFMGALPHVPQLSMDAMRYAQNQFGDRMWGAYGFTSAVNARSNYVNQLYVGIELGPAILLIENYRSGLIWDLFSRSETMKNFVQRARMSGVVDDFELPPEAVPYAHWEAKGGTLSITADQPQHGRKCLSIAPETDRIALIGQLASNDLLDFDFGHYVSFWTRDLEPLECAIFLDGKFIPLQEDNRVQGERWLHLSYRLPPHAAGAKLCGVQLVVRPTGARPALDNVTCEANPLVPFQAAIDRFSAETGRLGGAVLLHWALTNAGGASVDRYLVQAASVEKPEHIEVREFGPAVQPGADEERLILLEPGQSYNVTITPYDAQGHIGPTSPSIAATAAQGVLTRVAYDFENGSFDGWKASDKHLLLSVVPTDRGPALCVDFTKQDGWAHLAVPLDPQMAALHRFITLRIKGRVKLLGKLWSTDMLQQDLQAVESDDQWTEVRFDTWLATDIISGRDEAHKLLLFVNPGEWSGNGRFYIDDVSYAH